MAGRNYPKARGSEWDNYCQPGHYGGSEPMRPDTYGGDLGFRIVCEAEKAATVGDGKPQSTILQRRGMKVLTLGCIQSGSTLGFRLAKSDP